MAVSSTVGQAPLVSARRALVLTLVAACATVLLATTSMPDRGAIPHFATDDASFAVDGWPVGPAELSGRPDVAMVSRQYTSPSGRRFQVAISTSPEVKQIYRAGADVPFLGSGYLIESAPTDVVPARGDREALVARRGSEAWLQIAAFGERRGLVGNGLSAWSLAVFDLLLGRPNDYYLVRVIGAYDATSAREALELADVLLPRLSAWYAAQPV